MTKSRWPEVKSLLDATLALPADQRGAYLDQACAGDLELRQEVESLLEVGEEIGDFIEEPLVRLRNGGARQERTRAHDDAVRGERIGPYSLLRRLGQGGMGAVYLAAREEGDFKQQVAIKLIRPGLDSDEIGRRFHNERQILANLSHPNITRLLDGGTTADGQPYLVMEYVEGEPLDQYCDSHRLSTRERLALFQQVCSAVQLSHQNLVVHRDLKPGNILVTPEGVVKLLDFGIAKLLQPNLASRALSTSVGRRPMTVWYASPEQLRGEPVTTSSDIFSLGIVLYELLTGHYPFHLDVRTDEEAYRLICEEEPRKPSQAVQTTTLVPDRDGMQRELTPQTVSRTRDGDPRKLRRRLTGDLDAVVLKALRKEPQHRYASAEQLSEDLRRHLEGLPVIARNSTLSYRASRFFHRHRLGLTALGIFLLLGLSFSIAATVLWRQADRERQIAKVERNKAERMSKLLEGIFEDPDPDKAKKKDMSALEVLRRAQKRIDHDLADEPEVAAEFFDILVNVYRNLGSLERARSAARRSMDIRLSSDPNGSDPKLIRSISNYGVALYDNRELETAECALRRALEMADRLGLEDEVKATTMVNLGAILASKNDPKNAERLYRDALEIRERIHGEDHLEVAAILVNLGTLFLQRNDLGEAEALLSRAVRIRERHLEPKHTTLGNAYNTLARTYLALGRVEEARPLYEKALMIREERLQAGSILIAFTQRNLAAALLESDPARAEAVLAEALPVLENARPEARAEARSILGALRTAQGHYEEAEPLLLESHEALLEAHGEGSLYAREASERLVALYEAWGKPEEAARYRHSSTPPLGTEDSK